MCWLQGCYSVRCQQFLRGVGNTFVAPWLDCRRAEKWVTVASVSGGMKKVILGTKKYLCSVPVTSITKWLCFRAPCYITGCPLAGLFLLRSLLPCRALIREAEPWFLEDLVLLPAFRVFEADVSRQFLERSRAPAPCPVLSPQCDGMASLIFKVFHGLRGGIHVPWTLSVWCSDTVLLTDSSSGASGCLGRRRRLTGWWRPLPTGTASVTQECSSPQVVMGRRPLKLSYAIC